MSEVAKAPTGTQIQGQGLSSSFSFVVAGTGWVDPVVDLWVFCEGVAFELISACA